MTFTGASTVATSCDPNPRQRGAAPETLVTRPGMVATPPSSPSPPPPSSRPVVSGLLFAPLPRDNHASRLLGLTSLGLYQCCEPVIGTMACYSGLLIQFLVASPPPPPEPLPKDECHGLFRPRFPFRFWATRLARIDPPPICDRYACS